MIRDFPHNALYVCCERETGSLGLNMGVKLYFNNRKSATVDLIRYSPFQSQIINS